MAEAEGTDAAARPNRKVREGTVVSDKMDSTVVVAVVERPHEVGQVANVVRQIGVHLEEPLVPLGETLLEGLHVSGAQA